MVMVVLVLAAVAFGVFAGGLFMVSRAIRREDRALAGSLRFDPPSQSTRTARSLVGVSSSRWE